MQGSQMIYAILFIILAGQTGPKNQAVSCDPDPALAALFTPKRPAAGMYEVCAAPASIDIDIVLAGLTSEGVRFGPVDAADPLDVFGTAGSYERSAVSRLFGGRRANVAHGWASRGRALVSVTLVSPYPNRTLTALVNGTLVIRYVVESRGL
jgi:hypothetical protein